MDEVAYKLFDFVCRRITYTSDDGEWWRFPEETLRGFGDCDDSALLLASMLRRFYPPERVYAVAGTYRGLGHMWVTLDGEILEATYRSAKPVADPQNYRGLVAFNDVEVVEAYPGALAQLFELARNEPQKLALMAEAVNGR